MIRHLSVCKNVLELILSFGLTGLLRQIRDALTVWLDQWVLSNFKIRCPRCLKTRIWNDGHEKRKSRCAVQKFECPNCGKKFCINTFAPWYWHKYDPATIVGFLWVKNKFGYGLIECAKHACLAIHIPTWKTLWSWFQKFESKLIQKAARRKKKVSRYKAWKSDEMFILNRPVIGTLDPQTSTLLLTPSWYRDKKSCEKHIKSVVSHWGVKPRGWWTDEAKGYKAFEELGLPHKAVNHSEEYVTCEGVNTQAIENEWRQFRRWLFRINGIKHQAYVDFYPKVYETQHNVIKSPMDMLVLLL